MMMRMVRTMMTVRITMMITEAGLPAEVVVYQSKDCWGLGVRRRVGVVDGGYFSLQT